MRIVCLLNINCYFGALKRIDEHELECDVKCI